MVALFTSTRDFTYWSPSICLPIIVGIALLTACTGTEKLSTSRRILSFVKVIFLGSLMRVNPLGLMNFKPSATSISLDPVNSFLTLFNVEPVFLVSNKENEGTVVSIRPCSINLA